jgi:hypothetical protein
MSGYTASSEVAVDIPFDVILPGGVVKNDSAYAAKGRYVDSEFIRFWKGRPQKWKGWSNYIGITTGEEPARGGLIWNSNDGVSLQAYGTASRLWLVREGVRYDITPQGYTAGLVDQAPSDIGYGDGGYGDGPYGGEWSAVAGETGFPRVWTMARWGQDLVACPRGEEIYTWIYGDGDTLGITTTGTATISTDSLVVADASDIVEGMRVTGDGIPDDTFVDVVAGTTLTLSNDVTEEMVAVSVQFDMPAVPISSFDATGTSDPDPLVPTKVLAIFVTEDRTLVALGAAQGATEHDPLNVAFCSREDYTVWSPTALNTAGAIRCESGNRIMGAAKIFGGWLILTDLSAHPFTFAGGDDVFGLDRLGILSGAIGPQAMTSIDGIAYWMGFSAMFRYNGRVEQMDCDVQTHVFERVDKSQAYKIFAGTNVQYAEAIWFYPVLNDPSRENNSYFAVNIREQNMPWSIGDDCISRTTWIDINPLSNTPIGLGGDTYLIYRHETGLTGDGVPFSYLLETGEVELRNPEAGIQSGDQFIRLKKFVPNYAYVSGEHALEIDARGYPEEAPVTKGPYPMQNGMFNPKSRGRSFRFRMEGTGDFRAGDMRCYGGPDGRRA